MPRPEPHVSEWELEEPEGAPEFLDHTQPRLWLWAPLLGTVTSPGGPLGSSGLCTPECGSELSPVQKLSPAVEGGTPLPPDAPSHSSQHCDEFSNLPLPAQSWGHRAPLRPHQWLS